MCNIIENNLKPYSFHTNLGERKTITKFSVSVVRKSNKRRENTTFFPFLI
jgi:hypothetical protein